MLTALIIQRSRVSGVAHLQLILPQLGPNVHFFFFFGEPALVAWTTSIGIRVPFG